MTRYARTYGSIHHPNNSQEALKYPTGPVNDIFGVPVPHQERTFGLEEFNFHPLFLKEKIAYVPCFGSANTFPRPSVEELKLIYRVNANCYVHYATLSNVDSFTNDDIPNLRQLINPQMNQIYFRQESQAFFGADFPAFQKIIENMYASNFIANNQNNASFLINVRYKKIEILEKPVSCKLNSHFAGNWYINVQYPSTCK